MTSPPSKTLNPTDIPQNRNKLQTQREKYLELERNMRAEFELKISAEEERAVRDLEEKMAEYRRKLEKDKLASVAADEKKLRQFMEEKLRVSLTVVDACDGGSYRDVSIRTDACGGMTRDDVMWMSD